MAQGNMFRSLTPLELLVVSEDWKKLLPKLYTVLLNNVEIIDKAKLRKRSGCAVSRDTMEKDKGI